MKAVKITALIIGAALIGYIWVIFNPNRLALSRDEMQQETPVSTKTAQVTAEETWTMIFGGDVMFARTVDRLIEKNGGAWPMEKIASVVKEADLAVINLESPFVEGEERTPNESLIFRGNPKAIESLKNAGIDLASLANNHANDAKEAGYRQTVELLEANKIRYLGAGLSEEQAWQSVALKQGKYKIGFLAMGYGSNFPDGPVFIARQSSSRAIEAVKRLKKEHDIATVLCHCAVEYQPQANPEQVAFARSLIDAGADIYIGHHPHIPQQIEFYQNKPIVYSLGNLVFDQEPIKNRDRSALVKLTFKGKALEKLELLPYIIRDKAQPTFEIDEQIRQAIFNLFSLPEGYRLLDDQTYPVNLAPTASST